MSAMDDDLKQWMEVSQISSRHDRRSADLASRSTIRLATPASIDAKEPDPRERGVRVSRLAPRKPHEVEAIEKKPMTFGEFAGWCGRNPHLCYLSQTQRALFRDWCVQRTQLQLEGDKDAVNADAYFTQERRMLHEWKHALCLFKLLLGSSKGGSN